MNNSVFATLQSPPSPLQLPVPDAYLPCGVRDSPRTPRCAAFFSLPGAQSRTIEGPHNAASSSSPVRMRTA